MFSGFLAQQAAGLIFCLVWPGISPFSKSLMSFLELGVSSRRRARCAGHRTSRCPTAAQEEVHCDRNPCVPGAVVPLDVTDCDGPCGHLQLQIVTKWLLLTCPAWGARLVFLSTAPDPALLWQGLSSGFGTIALGPWEAASVPQARAFSVLLRQCFILCLALGTEPTAFVC